MARRFIMILGMSLAAFTVFHVILSLIGIGTGFIVVFGLIGGNRLPRMTGLFFLTTILTSLTGFLFPFKGVTPAIIVGILSMVVLLLAMAARYGGHLGGAWRGTYVVSVLVALYFNFFVLIVQSFAKAPALRALAPTQSEPPFKIAQAAALLLFVLLGVFSFRNFRRAEVRG
jgi:hypothetical protein